MSVSDYGSFTPDLLNDLEQARRVMWLVIGQLEEASKEGSRMMHPGRPMSKATKDHVAEEDKLELTAEQDTLELGELTAVTLRPKTYDQARQIGEHFRADDLIVMDLSDLKERDAKRLIDFAAGLIFQGRGSIER